MSNTNTDVNGFYMIEPSPNVAGTYTMTVSADGYVLDLESVPYSTSVTRDVRLQPTPRSTPGIGAYAGTITAFFSTVGATRTPAWQRRDSAHSSND